ncbi:uncharacterized protein CTRU02_206636 [Colletotrichum truncatum]|uniref:Uncharacterized protein n=1 Tax=Colletotrichum truncatum TaxID=5467 RepID=A0ACC3Z7H3_COLTU|nr:uncharacterized protein CTRU02_13758 [Colletotrichum truncatum]KAF6782932.1 hypothetical protein CTRU02_13758 [Colletotrichum truncatum]
MQFTTLFLLLAPQVMAATWNLSGTCKNQICEIDTQYTSPQLVCGNSNGRFSDTGRNGRSSCTGSSKCTYVWTC